MGELGRNFQGVSVRNFVAHDHGNSQALQVAVAYAGLERMELKEVARRQDGVGVPSLKPLSSGEITCRWILKLL